MSKWKALSHSDGKFTVNKFNEWAPSHPFTIPYQGPKIKYSEGDDITDITSPVFNIEFTGVPLSDQHTPCGYWHKNYIHPQTVIYTSCLYPLEFGDSITGSSIILESGYLNERIDHYLYTSDYVEDLGCAINSGIFRNMTLRIYPYEYIQSTSINIISGIFKEIVHVYTDISSISSTNIVVSSGIFKDVIINYDYWPPEVIEDLGILLLEGSHGN